MKTIRIGVVGLGHRGRELGKLAAEFPQVELAAACDIIPKNWYETQWLSTAPMAEMFPETVFYTDYDKMLDEANLDVVIVETGADIHCAFCCKALKHNINVLSDIPLVGKSPGGRRDLEGFGKQQRHDLRGCQCKLSAVCGISA